jgi:hypothetical protein
MLSSKPQNRSPFFALAALVFWLPVIYGCRSTTSSSREQPVVSASPIQFKDVAEEAGIRFQNGHQGRSPLNILETAGCGGALLDYDVDGRIDVLLIGIQSLALYRNVSRLPTDSFDPSDVPLRFEAVTKKAGLTETGYFMGAAVGDFDNDGLPDLLITGYGKTLLYHNRGGRYVNVTASSGLDFTDRYDWTTSATFVDLDNDGNLDLAVGRYVLFTPQTIQLCEYSGIKAACPPFYYTPQTLRVFRGDGKGRFNDVTQSWGFKNQHGYTLGVAACDFNDDGLQDLYVANDGRPADLWLNHGGGRFVNIGEISGTARDQEGQPQAWMGVDWGDYDGDGRFDLTVTTFQDQPTALFRNEGDNNFLYSSYIAGVASPTVNRLGFGVLLADFDGDSWLDMLIANGHVQDTVFQFRPPATYAQPTQCFHNLGNGGFADVSFTSGEALRRAIVGRGVCAGDLDNDGRLDALITNLEGAPLLLRNMAARSPWIGLRILDKPGGRDSIGARITVQAGDRKIVREVQTGRGYLSASDPRIVIGLKGLPPIESITIRWPDGRIRQIAPPKPNRYISVSPGDGSP